MSTGKRAGLWLMSFLYVLAGAMHFVRPEVYLPMMPPWLPAHRELVLLSGAAEVMLGLLLLLPATRRLAALGIILLLIAVFPANLHVALHDVPLFGAEKGAGIGNWIRLPFQLLLAWWAWAYARPEAPAEALRR